MLKYPLKHIGITQDYNPNTHSALDLGWYTSQSDPIYACGDGIVKKIYYFDEGGNTLYIKYDNGYSSEFMHIRDNTIKVKVGDRVTINQQVAQIGNTGTETTGPHLHVIIRNQNEVRVDPKSVLYVYPDQSVSAKDKDKVKYYNPISYVGNTVNKNINNNQIEIIDTEVRVRKTPGLNGEILGYINLGLYNYTNVKNIDNYNWYQLGTNMWVAHDESWSKIYEKVVQPDSKIEYVGTPINKNINNNQIEIIDTEVRVRKTPGLNGEILGYINLGIYNYTNIKNIDNYNWYQLGTNMWVAHDESWSKIYEKKVLSNDEINNLNNTVIKQVKEIKQLQLKITELENRIKELQ